MTTRTRFGFLVLGAWFWSNGLMAADATFPKCVRPRDFSVPSFVASYEACVDRQYDFCKRRGTLPACVNLARSRKANDLTNIKDEDIPKRKCSILKDGSYRCAALPLKLLPKDPEPILNIPAASPEPSPAEAGKNSAAGGSGAGGSGESGSPLNVPTVPNKNLPAPIPGGLAPGQQPVTPDAPPPGAPPPLPAGGVPK